MGLLQAAEPVLCQSAGTPALQSNAAVIGAICKVSFEACLHLCNTNKACRSALPVRVLLTYYHLMSGFLNR